MTGDSSAAPSAPAKGKGKARSKGVAVETAAAERKKGGNQPREPFPVISGYEWVRGDVGEFQSVFKSFLEINAMWKSHKICQSSISKLIRLEPCQPGERVYMGGIMGRSKWRELKSRYNVAEIEVHEPQEKEIAPLETRRKRKRGEKEVRGTSAPRDAEEVTSQAADADAVDLTGSPPPEGVSQVAVEEVAHATKARPEPNAAKVQAAPSSDTPGLTAPTATQAASAPNPTKVRREGSSSEVPTPTPASSTPPSRPSKEAPKGKYIAQRFDKDRPLTRLDHVSASSDIDSLWSSGVTTETFYPKGSLRSADQAMIEKVGPVEGLDFAEVFMQRAMAILDH
ncbi:uncharacterized protein LOC109787829 [Cajanus cajan]|uniref:uncharacterized protein LOC109787829 n=1 Tax=Cajanus cajan TaxID=3821 RepID=UPI00098D9496|nr:uncharacterized protein LOC109787829 [Cajanus cajan]